MTRTDQPRARWARAGLQIALAATGSALLAGLVSATHAAYQDRVELNAGAAAAVGNPVEFEVQVQDTAGEWQDADTEDDSVAVVTIPDATVTTSRATEFEVRFRLQPGSPPGTVVPSLTARSGCDTRCVDLFSRLSFSVAYDGVPLAGGVTAEGFNALEGREFIDLQPGDEHTVSLQFALDPDTPPAWSGSATAVVLAFAGVSS
ncbi:hypothetical protein [Leucobacter luti]|uniref:Ribosomally synthesized peptide with SipW-like signal peptide n=1 Tax=Leucobacter luti TaxID=340320 RepID=A0A4Q7TM44_9MICO|nr:hypothetical protein [Leucobacter luti]MBL3700210.1 hypothetical protein [Leucobacter luti]RZT61067.1 hypothetical protein EV139_2814 [Leucobacter luti]